MKGKKVKKFKTHYNEVVIDHDIVNDHCGFRCVEVFTDDGSKYNILDREGNVLCDEWYDHEIWMSELCEDGVTLTVGQVRKGGAAQLHRRKREGYVHRHVVHTILQHRQSRRRRRKPL